MGTTEDELTVRERVAWLLPALRKGMLLYRERASLMRPTSHGDRLFDALITACERQAEKDGCAEIKAIDEAMVLLSADLKDRLEPNPGAAVQKDSIKKPKSITSKWRQQFAGNQRWHSGPFKVADERVYRVTMSWSYTSSDGGLFAMSWVVKDGETVLTTSSCTAWLFDMRAAREVIAEAPTPTATVQDGQDEDSDGINGFTDWLTASVRSLWRKLPARKRKAIEAELRRARQNPRRASIHYAKVLGMLFFVACAVAAYQYRIDMRGMKLTVFYSEAHTDQARTPTPKYHGIVEWTDEDPAEEYYIFKDGKQVATVSRADATRTATGILIAPDGTERPDGRTMTAMFWADENPTPQSSYRVAKPFTRWGRVITGAVDLGPCIACEELQAVAPTQGHIESVGNTIQITTGTPMFRGQRMVRNRDFTNTDPAEITPVVPVLVDFGDGTKETVPSDLIVHTYLRPGTFQMSITPVDRSYVSGSVRVVVTGPVRKHEVFTAKGKESIVGTSKASPSDPIRMLLGGTLAGIEVQRPRLGLRNLKVSIYVDEGPHERTLVVSENLDEVLTRPHGLDLSRVNMLTVSVTDDALGREYLTFIMTEP